MYRETETFYAKTETEVENCIHDFLDEPGISYVSEKRYRDDDGIYIIEVKYTTRRLMIKKDECEAILF